MKSWTPREFCRFCQGCAFARLMISAGAFVAGASLAPVLGWLFAVLFFEWLVRKEKK